MGKSQTPLDCLFEVLTDQRRRYVLYYLDEADDPVVTVAELADHLCTWEREWDDRTAQSTDTHRENIRIALHHVHLPQMADRGLIEYDARSLTVRSRIENSLLDAVQDEADECPRLEALFTNVEVNS